MRGETDAAAHVENALAIISTLSPRMGQDITIIGTSILITISTHSPAWGETFYSLYSTVTPAGIADSSTVRA